MYTIIREGGAKTRPLATRESFTVAVSVARLFARLYRRAGFQNVTIAVYRGGELREAFSGEPLRNA